MRWLSIWLKMGIFFFCPFSHSVVVCLFGWLLWLHFTQEKEKRNISLILTCWKWLLSHKCFCVLSVYFGYTFFTILIVWSFSPKYCSLFLFTPLSITFFSPSLCSLFFSPSKREEIWVWYEIMCLGNSTNVCSLEIILLKYLEIKIYRFFESKNCLILFSCFCFRDFKTKNNACAHPFHILFKKSLSQIQFFSRR